MYGLPATETHDCGFGNYQHSCTVKQRKILQQWSAMGEFPSDHVVPLITLQWQVAVGLNLGAEILVHGCFRRGTNCNWLL